jgi:hypothetical protein
MKNLLGMTFGRLTVISRAENGKDKSAYWNCVCACSKIAKVKGQRLFSGKTKSCGCLVAEATRKAATTHGKTKTPEYNSWFSIKYRCFNKNSKRYMDYGGRGITMCERWRNSFENFLADMGQKPSPKHSIDRINNDGNYEPSNCRWATPKEQANNRRQPQKMLFDSQTL